MRLEDGLHLRSGRDDNRAVGLFLLHVDGLRLAKLQEGVELLRRGLPRRTLRQQVVECDLKGYWACCEELVGEQDS